MIVLKSIKSVPKWQCIINKLYMARTRQCTVIYRCVNFFTKCCLNTLQISKTGEETEVLMTGEEEHCNWMMFIRLAPTLLEQNCTVYCDANKFYIVTKTEIKDEELFLWFSAEMCLNLGKSQRSCQNTRCSQTNRHSYKQLAVFAWCLCQPDSTDEPQSEVISDITWHCLLSGVNLGTE